MATIIAFKARQEIEQSYTTGANIAPFFAHDLTDVYNATTNKSGYWYATPTNITQLEDGWAHVKMDNTSGTGTMYAYFRTKETPVELTGEDCACLIEVKNMSTTASSTQLWANFAESTLSGLAPMLANKSDTCRFNTNGTHRHTLKVNNASGGMMTNSWFGVAKGVKAEFDVRISIYQGSYDGSFQPYEEV